MYRTDAHEDRTLLILGVEASVTAFRRDNGEVAWTFQHQAMYGFYVDFVVLNGRVFIAAGNFIVCVDYKTGRPIGQTLLRSKIVRLLEDESFLYAFGDEHLYCVSSQGTIVWERAVEIPTAYKMPTFGFPGNIIHGFRDSG